MQVGLWAAAGLALLTAVFAGWRDWRRRRRSDPDAVGIADWPMVQIIALIAALCLATLAWHASELS